LTAYENISKISGTTSNVPTYVSGLTPKIASTTNQQPPQGSACACLWNPLDQQAFNACLMGFAPDPCSGQGGNPPQPVDLSTVLFVGGFALALGLDLVFPPAVGIEAGAAAVAAGATGLVSQLVEIIDISNEALGFIQDIATLLQGAQLAAQAAQAAQAAAQFALPWDTALERAPTFENIYPDTWKKWDRRGCYHRCVDLRPAPETPDNVAKCKALIARYSPIAAAAPTCTEATNLVNGYINALNQANGSSCFPGHCQDNQWS